MKRIHYISYLFLLSFIFSAFPSSAHFGSKGPYGGTVTCSIVYDTTVYIGTANGGVFESTTSKLVAWRARPVGLKSGKITALARSGAYLYAGTADSGIYIFNGFVGSDRYWKKINNGLSNLKIKSLLAIDSVTVLAGTDGNGIFKTTDKGATWTHIANSTLDNAVVTGFAQSGTKLFVTGSAQGVFISGDKGATWADFNDAKTLNVPGTTSVSFNATSNELIVLNGNGLLRTAVAASNPVAAYSAVSNGLPGNAIPQVISNNGVAWFLVSSDGIFTTPSNSISWMPINTGLPATVVSSVVAFQTSLIAGTFGEGIFKASIANPSWTANNFGFNNLRTYSMVCSGAALVVAATEKGVFVSKDLANSYKRANKGLTDSLNVNDLLFFGTKLLAATQNGGVFISADTGASWTPFNSGLSNLPILRLAASSSYIYAFDGLCGLFQSDGASWKSIFSSPQSLTPGSLAFFGGKIAMSLHKNEVLISNEKNIGFKPFSTGLPASPVTSLVARGPKLFAGTDGAGVYATDTVAANWTATAPTTISHTSLMELNGSRIEAMAAYGGYVFASYKGGLLATSDYGTTWIAGGNQFNLPSYTNIYEIDFVTTRVFVTSEYNGLYSNALSELPPNSVEMLESNIGNFNIYPNPSNGIVHIDLKNMKGTVKEVIVYDRAGRKVSTVKPASSPVLTTTLNLAPGMYFIQVLATEGTAIQKVVIE